MNPFVIHLAHSNRRSAGRFLRNAVALLFLCLIPGYGAGSGVDDIRLIPLPQESVRPVAPEEVPGSVNPPDAVTVAAHLQQALQALNAKRTGQAPPGGGLLSKATASALRSRLGTIRAASRKPMPASLRQGGAPYRHAGPAVRGLEVHLRGSGTPRLLRGALQPGGGRPSLQSPDPLLQAFSLQDDEAAARSFLRNYRDYLRIDDPEQELQISWKQEDELGYRHLRFTQKYRDLPVWPAGLIVHADAGGNVASLSGTFIPTPRKLNTLPVVDAARAEQIARAYWNDGLGETTGPDLIVYGPVDRSPRLAWKMTLTRSLRERWVVVVDAVNGKILTRYNAVEELAASGSGTDLFGVTRPLGLWREGGIYYLADTGKPMFDAARSNPPQAKTTRGAIIVQDARNQPATSDPKTIPATVPVSSTTPNGGWLGDAVSAAFAFSKTYDYYLERHGRNSVDGTGGNILGVVRLGKGFDNAFWASDLRTMFFGDAEPFAGALDVVAHELTHGVTAYTANLVYQGQSGALNEAFSDIFGEMVEAYVQGSNDWRLGSQLGTPVRDMKNPASLLLSPGLPYPEKMSQYIRTARDNGGVHYNSGIINKAYYLLAEGLSQAIGRADAERIFYRALAFHLTQNAQFADARLACIQAAEELFGAGSAQAARVGEAFDTVEVFNPSGTSGIAPPISVGGQDAALYVYFDPGVSGYLVGRREFAEGDGTTGTPLSAGLVQAARPSVSADGGVAIYVNAGQDACLVDTQYPVLGEQCLGLGNIHSVAMAPDGENFAFVLLDASGQPGNEIVEIDIKRETSRTYKLVAPGTEGVNIGSVVQADAMAFTSNDRFLIYDALNVIRQDDGSEVGAWSIYAIDLATDQTLILVPPVVGEDIGNPAVGNLSDDLLAFDAQDQVTGNTRVMAARLSTGQIGQIAQTTGLAAPVYAGDDGAIVYSVADGSATGRSLYRQALRDDRITPAGAAEVWLVNAEYGVVYRRGARFKLRVKLAGKGAGRVLSTPQGIDCGYTCAGLYPKGTRLRLTATADYGSKFVRWKGACTGAKGCKVKMKKVRTVTAVFKKLSFHRLSVSKSGTGTGQVTGSPAGIACGGVCTGTYSSDQVIRLTATPDADSVFQGWRGACRGKRVCRLKMSKNRKVSARFASSGGG